MLIRDSHRPIVDSYVKGKALALQIFCVIIFSTLDK